MKNGVEQNGISKNTSIQSIKDYASSPKPVRAAIADYPASTGSARAALPDYPASTGPIRAYQRPMNKEVRIYILAIDNVKDLK